ncbi:hypothetical protein LshimejAT787_0600820 [Lyophyllum shimeji]|uniref:DUF6533 domain-containing protein n=1 Tax=Lyophyllum shimeji TaxID=47721 RepID=A0A9P3UPE7_LYOSH|nr:hypothetical protein LshimejAT787_0600820 [Lyophyllum shimeji]
MSDALPVAELTRTASHLMAAKMFSLASCVMLFYDIALTLGDEVERVWLRKFTPITALWFLNRYLSPLGYIVIITSFHMRWSEEVCNRYVLFPEALKVVTSCTIGVVFIIRLYAIYSRSTAVVVVGALCLAGEIGVKIWSFTDGTHLKLPEGLVGCILVGRHDYRFVCTWIVELAFDSVVFFATLYRVIEHNRMRHGTALNLLNLILRDGVMYFGVIFVANLLTVLMFLLAPPDIKAMNASFSTLITSLMVSRLILNLRGAADRPIVVQSAIEMSITGEFTHTYESYGDSPKALFGIRQELSAIKAG